MSRFRSAPRRCGICLVSLTVLLALAGDADCQSWSAIPRVLPPAGDALTEGDRERLAKRLEQLQQLLQEIESQPFAADAQVLLKAVELALLHDEFYDPRDAAKADEVLQLAETRVAELARGHASWKRQTGLVVRGFTSRVDGSAQPYGLVIPDAWNFQQPATLYVWLHGRGDKTTDLHFVHQRMKQVGQIAPADALVLHPFGRQCLGFKSAGETDVLEAIQHVQEHYPIDAERVVLIGFSMGGAGAWHLGAHYTDHWVAVSPGAGFAETARYNRLSADAYPPAYEQTLWNVYDVPAYVRNLFQVPVYAYSGELDRQIQAARVMEQAFAAEGRQLTHLIGPGVEHRYHPDTLKQLLAKLADAAAQGRQALPANVSLQTRTLRYPRQRWVEAMALEQHWLDSRIDAQRRGDATIQATTANVRALQFHLPADLIRGLNIDGQDVDLVRSGAQAPWTFLRNEQGAWVWQATPPTDRPVKSAGRQGPIDDAFLEPFLVVTPTATAPHPRVEQWVQFELEHFRSRWRSVFRGQLREKRDVDVGPDDWNQYHLVIWGDPDSNVLLRKLLSDPQPFPLPLAWNDSTLSLGGQSADSANHVPLLIYPNPLQPAKYVVLNSGPTFREQHDRTNSQQNPKLPDWALIDIRTAPDGAAAGRVVAADFFDEDWQPRPATNQQP